MSDDSAKTTPMFAQYRRIKAEHPDALLFYRMGDFYELFFDDALTAAKELQITLTARNKNAPDPVPMCGVPWHSAQGYIAELVNKGYSVAICDQTEEPRLAKGLVQRAVTRVITPGTVLEDDILDAKHHNYLAALCENAHDGHCGLVYADVSTGQCTGIGFKRQADLWQWVQKLTPKELLLPEHHALPPQCKFEGIRLLRLPSRDFDLKRATERVLETQGVRHPNILDLQGKDTLMRAYGALLRYLDTTQMGATDHLNSMEILNLSRRLIIDEATGANLEIFTRLNGRKGKGTLRHLLDETVTPMGSRLLEDMLHHPWREIGPILRIQDAVAYLCANDDVRAAARALLKKIGDLERICARISLNRSTPHDFITLRASLAALPDLYAIVAKPATTAGEAGNETNVPLPEALRHLADNSDPLEDCTKFLYSALVENPATVITEGGLFKAGYHADLDALLDLIEHGGEKLQAMLEDEQRSTGVSKLKIGYNRVFGYYYELYRSADMPVLPDRFIRRQTLANAERYTTEELKKLEAEILSATERRNGLEYKLFQDLREHMARQRERILHAADCVAQLDYWQGLAETGRKNRWSRPALADDTGLDIREGRHPVVESIVGGAVFVPNSFSLDHKRRLCLLTGPNMAGKSTILRQVALICLLAQIGSLVPAEQATIGIVDRLFSRVGASDNLTENQSTFMVEMMETARILRQAGRRSLIILDEIGRGTSTFDGVALAWAVVEDLTKTGNLSPRTLFATHYHELTALEGVIPHVFTMNVAIREYNNDIVFLHRLVPGPSDRSYGIEVARLAGVPAPVVQRAKIILARLERGRSQNHKTVAALAMALPGLGRPAKTNTRLKESTAPSKVCGTARPVEHPLLHRLRKTDPEAMSPLEALKLVAEWKKLWGSPESS
ncbi:MAG: DNA mismatch repair protein MutS [Desulfovibrio sp.]|jgi:DNA mismatch repair protein MutS|nr:DNA mismatch repair protein MutS [Desulfovibrio sp.]